VSSPRSRGRASCITDDGDCRCTDPDDTGEEDRRPPRRPFQSVAFSFATSSFVARKGSDMGRWCAPARSRSTHAAPFRRPLAALSCMASPARQGLRRRARCMGGVQDARSWPLIRTRPRRDIAGLADGPPLHFPEDVACPLGGQWVTACSPPWAALIAFEAPRAA